MVNNYKVLHIISGKISLISVIMCRNYGEIVKPIVITVAVVIAVEVVVVIVVVLVVIVVKKQLL